MAVRLRRTDRPPLADRLGHPTSSTSPTWTPCFEKLPKSLPLCISYFQDVPLKDFGREVRAQLDIDNFLNDAIVLLDLEENNLENILDRVLMKIQDSRHANFDLDEAKALLCTHDQGKLTIGI